MHEHRSGTNVRIVNLLLLLLFFAVAINMSFVDKYISPSNGRCRSKSKSNSRSSEQQQWQIHKHQQQQQQQNWNAQTYSDRMSGLQPNGVYCGYVKRLAESAIHIQRKYTIVKSVAFRTSQRTVRSFIHFMQRRRFGECKSSSCLVVYHRQ